MRVVRGMENSYGRGSWWSGDFGGFEEKCAVMLSGVERGFDFVSNDFE